MMGAPETGAQHSHYHTVASDDPGALAIFNGGQLGDKHLAMRDGRYPFCPS